MQPTIRTDGWLAGWLLSRFTKFSLSMSTQQERIGEEEEEKKRETDAKMLPLH